MPQAPRLSHWLWIEVPQNWGSPNCQAELFFLIRAIVGMTVFLS